MGTGVLNSGQTACMEFKRKLTVSEASMCSRVAL